MISTTLLSILFYLAQILVLSLILWMAVDAAMRDKYLWIVLIVGLPLIGALIYLIVEKRYVYHRVVCRACSYEQACERHAKHARK